MGNIVNCGVTKITAKQPAATFKIDQFLQMVNTSVSAVTLHSEQREDQAVI